MNLPTIEAKKNQKMIQLRIYLYTDHLAQKKGAIRPKHAWDGGRLCVPANELHGITAGRKLVLHGFSDLPCKIEKILKENGITIHKPRTKTKAG